MARVRRPERGPASKAGRGDRTGGPREHRPGGEAPSRAAKPGPRADARPEARNPAPAGTAPERTAPEKSAGPAPERVVLPAPAGALPASVAPVILTLEPSPDYALLDSGAGEKLERYGPLIVRRPENQAIWPRRLAARDWDGADAIFTGDIDEEGAGRWRFPKEPLGETWPLLQDGLSYHGRFTSFRHVGVFPEQAAHWSYAAGAIERAGRPVRLLNLFGYTGLASLLAARAGAEVTHVDASKKAILWARENQDLAGLADRPIRWICEDAVRYAEREVKRGSRYDAILLDPPKFGRGPKGEVWQIFDDLPYLMALMRALLSARPLFVILTAYSIRSSFYGLSALMQECFRGAGGTVEAGELLIREAGAEPRLLSTSLFSRWTPTP